MQRRSLRFRIALTLLLLVSVSTGLFALAAFYVSGRLEERLLDETLNRDFREFERLYHENSARELPYSSALRSFLVHPDDDRALPPELWGLRPGTHHDVRLEGRYYHVLVRELGDKRLFLAHDITRIEERETRFAIFLIVGVLLTGGIAVWLGYLLSRRVIAPVSLLASRVSQLDPGQPRTTLAGEFTGAEVEVIAQAFDRFLQRLDRFMERERAFTEDASHELRTPLAVINSAAELALADPQAPESARRPLQRIQRASQQMTRLTNALLFLARESGGRAQDSEQCQADAVIGEVLETYRHATADAQVDLQCGALEPTRLAVPAEFIEIIVANLVQNALANTERGQVRAALEQGILTVEDTGRGIPPEDLPHIFDRYFRGVESRGVGRGLDLVRRICNRQGWRIEVWSEPGQGTRFKVHFRP